MNSFNPTNILIDILPDFHFEHSKPLAIPFAYESHRSIQICNGYRDIGFAYANVSPTPQSPEGQSSSTTHRIDKAIVIERAAAAGLKLVEESDLLANANDDYAKNVFDPSVRRKTDRFLLKFAKQ